MHKVNIVIEGCDCTGKTTLKALLMERLGFVPVKMSAPQSFTEGLKQNIEAVGTLNSHAGLVFDRGLLGECVYGPIKRGYYPEYMRSLEKLILPHNILVLLTADPETVKERFDGEFITVDEIPDVLEAFNEEISKCNWPNVIEFNTSYDDPETILYRVEEEIAKW